MRELPIPPHFDPERVGEVWRVPYQERAAQAASWARAHGIRPAEEDRLRICLVAVDVQNTFCVPGFELFVGGRSGSGAVDDNRRLCAFLYRNLASITRVIPTMDTHHAMQIFHPVYLVNEARRTSRAVHAGLGRGCRAGGVAVQRGRGTQPRPDRRGRAASSCSTMSGGWPPAGSSRSPSGPTTPCSAASATPWCRRWRRRCSSTRIARASQPDFQVKGSNPLTEHYSIIGPEVTRGAHGETIAERNKVLVDHLHQYDAVIIAGQAKSHCVAWTIADLLAEVQERDLLARSACVPARGLHLARGGAGGDRLHRRGRRRLPALRRGRLSRRALDGPALDLART